MQRVSAVEVADPRDRRGRCSGCRPGWCRSSSPTAACSNTGNMPCAVGAAGMPVLTGAGTTRSCRCATSSGSRGCSRSPTRTCSRSVELLALARPRRSARSTPRARAIPSAVMVVVVLERHHRALGHRSRTCRAPTCPCSARGRVRSSASEAAGRRLDRRASSWLAVSGTRPRAVVVELQREVPEHGQQLLQTRRRSCRAPSSRPGIGRSAWRRSGGRRSGARSSRRRRARSRSPRAGTGSRGR